MQDVLQHTYPAQWITENANDDERRSIQLTAAFLYEEDDEGGSQEGHPKSQVESYLEAQVLSLVLCQLSWGGKLMITTHTSHHRKLGKRGVV